MDWQRIWVLRGANIWAQVPVLEVELELHDLQDATTATFPGMTERLLTWLPSLGQRRSAEGNPLAEQLRQGLGLAPVLQHVALELQVLAGSPVDFGLVQTTSRPGFFRVIVAFEEEEVARPCLEAARELCLAAAHDRPFDLAARLAELREVAYDVRLGPSTAAIVRAAEQRNIPVRRLNTGSLVLLGHGCRQRRICTAETDRTSAVAETVAQDKRLTCTLLQAVGVPVPEGRQVASAEEAWEVAEDLGPPVVVKPQHGNHGRGVATNLTTREQVVRAFAAAREEGEQVMVERFIPGDDYRLLVIGERLVAAARREPAQVLGDGRSTIRQLVDLVNQDPRRSDGHATVLSHIKLDTIGLAVLAEQGYTPDSVPPAGERVLIRRNGNLSTGGTATDVTDLVHPEVAARAVDAARAIGLDIAGVDVVACDITVPLEEQRGGVVEVNAGPGLRMHLEPSAGKPRPVGEAIVASLFPGKENGRIPLVAVTGVNGKTTTTRLLAHLLRRTDGVIGMSCTDGLYIDGRRIDTRDCSGPRSARSVLLNPRVQAAVLETARGGILREGLGFDQCDVAVVTNIGSGDHLSLRGIETLEDLARVKRVVVEAVAPHGVAVLNAADPLVRAMAEHCPGSVIYFARDGAQPTLAEHRAAGGKAVFVRDGVVILAEGQREEKLLSLERIPLTHAGRVAFQVENVLAAAGAFWALGRPLDALRAGLETFTGDVGQAPARFNVLQANGATLILDYAHNPSALAALVEALAQFPAPRRTLVFSAANRRDIDVLNMGEIVGNGFDRVILYRDTGNNERRDGELNGLLRRGLSAGRRVRETLETQGETAAVELALQTLRPGELVVLGIEAIEPTLAFVRSYLDRQMPAPSSPADPEPAVTHSPG